MTDDAAKPVVDDETFMENVREALGNGYEAVCAYCGTGLAGDGLDMHERGCPYPEQASRSELLAAPTASSR